MKKSERGAVDDWSSPDNIEIVRWNDNSVVMVGSNSYGVEPLVHPKRWVKGKGRINVQQPSVIGHYNCVMGGVDLVDRALSNFRSVIHGKKWYWPLLVNALNIGFVYCRRLFRIIADDAVEQKTFRHHIVSILLRQFIRVTPARSLPAAKAFMVADEIRLDGVNHYPKSGPICKCTVCKKSCRNTCSKCNSSIHVNTCFQLFHEK